MFLGVLDTVRHDSTHSRSRRSTRVRKMKIHKITEVDTTRAMESFLVVFLALNICFLVGTAIWFRLDHATRSHRSNGMNESNKSQPIVPFNRGSMTDELAWQYSLRSNLLLFGCVQSSYLLYLGDISFLLLLFSAFSVLNVLTDHFYRYENADIFAQAKKGHRIAGVIIWTVSLTYMLYG